MPTAWSPSAGLPIASELAIVFGRTGATGRLLAVGGGDRLASLSLRADQPGWRPVHETELDELAEAPAELREERSRRDRADDGVRQPPAQLLGDLEGERLRTFRVVRAQADVDEGPRGQLERELDREPAAVVVASAYLVDRRAVRGGGQQLLALESGGAEDRGVEPLDGGACRDRCGEIPGRRARQCPEPELLRLGARDRDDPVLEGVRRVGRVQLEMELAQAERFRESGRPHERRQARRKPRLDRRLHRQQ